MKRLLPLLFAIGSANCSVGNRALIIDPAQPPGRYELVDVAAGAAAPLAVRDVAAGQYVGFEYENSRQPTAAIITADEDAATMRTVWRQPLPKGSDCRWRAVGPAGTSRP